MDNKQIIILKQEKPVNRIYVISGPTQIGRAQRLKWEVQNRKMPPQFSQLEAIISVEESTRVSRNHAGIYRGEDDKFYIVDLNSKNHTFVNGENISSGSGDPVPKMLALGDMIAFSDDLELKVVGFKDVNRNNHCLLIGSDGGNLKGVKKDLDELEMQLVKRGFAGNIVKLCGEDAAKNKILGQLEQAAYLTASDSHFIFHYSGHGNKNGLDLNPFEVISPSELYSKLANIRGKKAIILDCCHAGIFLSEKNKKEVPPNCLILAASSKSGKAYEQPNYAIAGGAYMGKFSAALVEYLDDNKKKLDLRDFKQKLDEIFKSDMVSIYYQEPIITGGSFTMMSAPSVSSMSFVKPVK